MPFRYAAILLSALAALFVAACQPPAQLLVEKAYVQVSPVEDRPSSGYFTVQGGPANVALMAVTARSAQRVEMHETVQKDGVSEMRPIDSVPVKIREKVAFAPGGKHLMLWGIDGSARAAGKIELVFIFSNGDRIAVDAPLQDVGGNPVGGSQAEPAPAEQDAG